MSNRDSSDYRCFIRWLVSWLYGGGILGQYLREERKLQEPRRESYANNDGTVSNFSESEKQSTRMKREPLMTLDKGPIVAAIATIAASLMTYLFTTMGEIDGRLDSLERQTTELLDKDGNVRPSKQGLEAYYGVQRLEEELQKQRNK